MKHDRSWYVPKGARCFRDRKSSAVVYAYESEGPQGIRYLLIGFHGRAQKPDFHFRYPSAEKREAKAKSHFEAWQAVEGYKAERHAAKKAFQHDFKPGDIFRSSWGYEQTNIDYYELIEVRGKHLIVSAIGQEREAVAWAQEKCVPVPGKFIGKPFRVLAQPNGFKVDRHWASYEAPKIVAGIKVYEASHSTSYA